jgi:hypothetical protein
MSVQNKTEQLVVRLTPQHMAEIRERASSQGFRLSEWVRRAVVERARREAWDERTAYSESRRSA